MKRKFRGIFGEPIIVEMSLIKALGFDFLKGKNEKKLDKLLNQQDEIVGGDLSDNKAVFGWMEIYADAPDLRSFEKAQEKLINILSKMKKNPDAQKVIKIAKDILKLV